MDPRPNATNIRAAMKVTIACLQAILSYQSTRYWCIGIICVSEEYSLMGKAEWADSVDPGFYRHLGGTVIQQRDMDVQYETARNIFLSQENAQLVMNDALNAAVQINYCRSRKPWARPPIRQQITPNRSRRTWQTGIENQHLERKKKLPRNGEHCTILQTQLKSCLRT